MSERQLWAAVVLQAADDLHEAPYQSTDFVQSRCFFTGPGAWASWRQDVADALGLHGDDLTRMGEGVLRERFAREPFPLAIASTRPRAVAIIPPSDPAPTARKTAVRGARSNAWLAGFLRLSA